MAQANAQQPPVNQQQPPANQQQQQANQPRLPSPWIKRDAKYVRVRIPTVRNLVETYGRRALAAGALGTAYYLGHNRVLSTIADRIGKFGKNTWNKIVSAVNSYKPFGQDGEQNTKPTATPEPTPTHDKTL
jgi:hypothetical protein